ncbi:hypothetical protein EVA_18258 [gut metagenome]|uniref:Uncharacterized protein n=1 Tax=gut metagenome TaxID=749906 RepID=J9FFF7_9ZZZZ
MDDPLVSIIIPNKDSCRCSALPRVHRGQEHLPLYEVIVVENNSTDPETFAYYETLADLPTVRVIRYEGPSTSPPSATSAPGRPRASTCSS